MIRVPTILSPVPILLVIIFLSACLPGEEPSAPHRKPVPVRVETVQVQDLPVVVTTVGRLTPNREVTLSAEIAGVISGYEVDVGDVVNEGQILVTFDPLDYNLALNEARATLLSARAQLDAADKAYQRAKNLLPRKVISNEAYERTEAEYKSSLAGVKRAQALVDIAAQRLNKTGINAPFSGFVATRAVETGQTISPGQPVMSIVDLSVMRVKVHLSEKDYVHLDKEDHVIVTVDALPGLRFEGRPDRMDIKADPGTNTFGVEVLVNNPDGVLKAGLTARLNLTVRTMKEVILIPQSAVLYRGDRQEVFVAGADDRAEARSVVLGESVTHQIQVNQGLKNGDRLVVVGAQYLKPGDGLQIIDSNSVATP
jgi:RND family efflux transporter MFP subunit